MEPCIQEGAIGKIQEYIESTKGFKATLFTISIAIVIQVASFLFLWGSLTTTVKSNTEYLWHDISPKTLENTRNIDKILAKMELIIRDRSFQ